MNRPVGPRRSRRFNSRQPERAKSFKPRLDADAGAGLFPRAGSVLRLARGVHAASASYTARTLHIEAV